MFDIVPGKPIQPDSRVFAVRIIHPTIFRGAHAAPGIEFHDLSSSEFVTMTGCGRAVKIARRAAVPPVMERAEAVPVVEVPEARVIPSGPSAVDARAEQPQPQPPARKRRAK